MQQTTKKVTETNGVTPRPHTPPADYDLNDLHISDQHHKQGQQQNQRAAIF